MSQAVVEFRTYRLRPGTQSRFVALMQNEAVPLLTEFGIDVVACGASTIEENAGDETAYLIRAFASADQLAEREAEFYASDEWCNGPREAIIECIEHYISVVAPRSALVALGYRS